MALMCFIISINCQSVSNMHANKQLVNSEKCDPGAQKQC